MSIDCKYHTQDEVAFCGPACAMMVLGSSKFGFDPAKLNQYELEQEILHAPAGYMNLDWPSDPDRLAYVLSNQSGAVFQAYGDLTEPEGSARLVSVLRDVGAPAVVARQQNYHWNVVWDVDTEGGDPLANEDYWITSFWINDPQWDSHRKEHSRTDTCGDGTNYPFNSIYYHDWQQNWLSYAPKGFISVSVSPQTQVKPPTQSDPQQLYDSGGLVPPEIVSNLLQRQFQRYRLFDKDRTKEFVSSPLGTPISVRRLDRDREFYYLVPALKDEGVLGYAQMDGLSGNLQRLFFGRSPTLPFELDLEKIRQDLLGKRIDLPGSAQRTFLLRDDEFNIDPQLVWQICQQSSSPHLPFWRIIAGRQIFYLRIDGKFFSRLFLGPFGA